MGKKKDHKTIIIISTIIIIILVLLGCLILKRYLETPEIELIGEKEITINLNEEYKENGVHAKLNGKEIETEISGEVDTSMPGEYSIKYIAKNNHSGRKNEIIRNVLVIDNISPVIELNGPERIEIYEGSEYEEKGAHATDNIDGDITSKIEIKGEIDT